MTSCNNPRYPQPPFTDEETEARRGKYLSNSVSPALSSVLVNPPGCVTKGWSLGGTESTSRLESKQES